ncbi:MAG: imidazole glycerol phosphate synthase subunit HisF [candidate division WOR-3 bacterium]
MLAKRIIVCLDTRDGRLVKGVRFKSLVDHGSPAEAAMRYYNEGADEICFLDISATQEGRLALADVVKDVVRGVFIPLTVGGGIKNLSDIRVLTGSGADKVSLNTAAVENPGLIEEVSRLLGSQSVVIAIDAARTPDGFRVFTHAGTRETRLRPDEWASEAVSLGAGEVLLTSIDADGTQEGYDIELLRTVRRAVNVPLIASGGAGKHEHFLEAFSAGADAALAASLFHEGRMSIGGLKNYLREKGVAVR